MKITIPEITITLPGPRLWKWVVPIFAVVAALTLTWGGGATAQQGGFGPPDPGQGQAGATVDFNLIMPNGGDICDTLIDDKKCLVPPGDTFPVLVNLDKNPGFAFEDSVISLTYSGGLTRVDLPDECAPGPFPGGAVETDDANPGDQSVYILECVASGPPVAWEGPLAEIHFKCPAFKSKETISIQYGIDNPITTGMYIDSQLVNFNFTGPSFATELSPLGLPYSETIVINCNNYYPWDVVGPGMSAELDGIVDLPNDILDVILHFCPLITMPCAKID